MIPHWKGQGTSVGPRCGFTVAPFFCMPIWCFWLLKCRVDSTENLTFPSNLPTHTQSYPQSHPVFGPPFSPKPRFQWNPQNNKILLNLGIKCWNPAYNAQASRLIIVAVLVGAVKIYVAAGERLRKKERQDERVKVPPRKDESPYTYSLREIRKLILLIGVRTLLCLVI